MENWAVEGLNKQWMGREPKVQGSGYLTGTRSGAKFSPIWNRLLGSRWGDGLGNGHAGGRWGWSVLLSIQALGSLQTRSFETYLGNASEVAGVYFSKASIRYGTSVYILKH